MSLHDHEPTGRDRPEPATQGVPPEEDLDGAEVTDDLEEAPEEKKNFTDDHPLDERMIEGE